LRIIFFNVWHGLKWEGLEKFLSSQVGDTDAFCLVEINPDLQKKLESLLKEFTPIYHKGVKTVYLNGITEGRSIFIKKGINILDSGAIKIFETSEVDAGGFQYTFLEKAGKRFWLGNVHGMAMPGTKKDTTERLTQSQRIIKFLGGKEEPKIFGGDFNLNPDTKSILLFEEAGYRNLIKEFGIKRTRNKLAWSEFGKNPDFVKQYFADYAFVSKEVKVTGFEVPEVDFSDHLPLILDFEI